MTNGAKILGLFLFFGATAWWFIYRTNPQTLSEPETVQTSSATAEWDANTEPDIAGYKLYLSSPASPTPTVIPSTGTSVTVTLSPDIPYSFRVTAVNTAGVESGPSNTVVYTVPTPASVDISGRVFSCSNPFQDAILILAGSASAVSISDANGNYGFIGLTPGGNYSVLPTKPRLPPGSPEINTVDLIGVQRHFLGILPLTGCHLESADVSGDGRIDTIDVTAIQAFTLSSEIGTGNVGKYQFSPASRNYPVLNTTQTGQDYDVVLLGDVAQ